MKKLNKAILLVATTFAATLGANASVTQDLKPYVGLKVANVNFDNSGNAEVKDATGMGIFGGFENANGLGVEFDYMETNDTDIKLNKTKVGEAEYKTYGASAVYRYNLSRLDLNDGLYVKGKLGVNNVELKVKGDAGETDKVDDTNFVWGAGLGYKFNEKFGTELTYEQQDSDVDVVGLSAYMKF